MQLLLVALHNFLVSSGGNWPLLSPFLSLRTAEERAIFDCPRQTFLALRRLREPAAGGDLVAELRAQTTKQGCLFDPEWGSEVGWLIWKVRSRLHRSRFLYVKLLNQ